jgi:hypothetical protein
MIGSGLASLLHFGIAFPEEADHADPREGSFLRCLTMEHGTKREAVQMLYQFLHFE